MSDPKNFSAFSQMSPDEITVHVVKLPYMTALASMGALLKEWPQKIVHHHTTYHFVSIDTLPELAAGNYSGAAKYEMREANQNPNHVTHTEVGAYFGCLGTVMKNKNCSMGDAKEPPNHSDKKAMIETLCSFRLMTEERAKIVEEYCWSKLNGAFSDTVPGPEPEDNGTYA